MCFDMSLWQIFSNWFINSDPFLVRKSFECHLSTEIHTNNNYRKHAKHEHVRSLNLISATDNSHFELQTFASLQRDNKTCHLPWCTMHSVECIVHTLKAKHECHTTLPRKTNSNLSSNLYSNNDFHKQRTLHLTVIIASVPTILASHFFIDLYIYEKWKNQFSFTLSNWIKLDWKSVISQISVNNFCWFWFNQL